MAEFKIGDWVYANDWCFGQIIDIHRDWACVEFDTGSGGGTFSFKLNELQRAKAPDVKTNNAIRNNLLVTAGARAAYMDCKGIIVIPGGLEGEDALAEFATAAVRTYMNLPDDIPFDEFIEKELKLKFGKKQTPKFVKYDAKTRNWFDHHPDAQTTVMCCEKCGLWYKPILGHKCKKENK